MSFMFAQQIHKVRSTIKMKILDNCYTYKYFIFILDCNVEKGTLHNIIYPELREQCRSKGYELHIVDLHWKTLLEKQQDHEFPELCIGELTSKLIVVVFVSYLGSRKPKTPGFICL